MTMAVQRLSAVRHAHRRLGEERPIRQLLYALYATILVAVIAGFPLAWGLAEYLSQPDSVAVLTAISTPHAVAVCCGLGLAGLTVAGSVRGPALRSPFLVTVLAGNDLPRSRSLRGPFLAATATVVGVCVITAVTIGGVLATAGQASTLAVVKFAAAAALFASLGGVFWLGGQVCDRGRAWAVTAVLATITLTTSAVPEWASFSPWGWVSLLWPSSASGSWWPLLLLALAAGGALALVPRLLNLLRGPALLHQSQRWHVAGLATATADFAGALATYRAAPGLGRHWRAIADAPLPLVYLRRDLVTALRTPGRLIAATAFLLVAGFLIACGAAAGVGWVAVAAGAAVGFMALGVGSDGFRHAAATAGSPPLFRTSTGRLFLLHALFPCLWGGLGMVGGAVIAQIALGASNGWGTAGIIAFFLLTVRAYDSAKGLLPPILLTPSPSPAGDLTGLIVLAWQADALIIATAVPSLLVATAGGSAAALIVRGALIIAALVLLTKRRLRRR